MSNTATTEINITAEQLAVLVEEFAQDKLEQLKDAAGIDKMVAAYALKLSGAHIGRFGNMAEREQAILTAIENNPEWFPKNKARKTTSAAFGMKAGKGTLKITDEEAIKKFAAKNGLQFVRVVEEIDKDAVKTALNNGDKVTGAEITGKEPKPFVALDKGLVDAIKDGSK